MLNQIQVIQLVNLLNNGGVTLSCAGVSSYFKCVLKLKKIRGANQSQHQIKNTITEVLRIPGN